MDSLINAAARALASGQALAALNLIALRDDAHALALCGIAMAQLGDLPRAQRLLKDAATKFGARELLSRARCATAEAEVALAARELRVDLRALEGAVRTFREHGQSGNLAHAQLLRARWTLMRGDVTSALRERAAIELSQAPDVMQCIAALLDFDLAMRQGRASVAESALARAKLHGKASGIGSLAAEVERARVMLTAPAARLGARMVTLAEVEHLRASDTLLIDGCARRVTWRKASVDLVRRPVLFALLVVLAEGAPHVTSRSTLVQRGFGMRRVNDAMRARLRVEIGRLRKLLADLVDIVAADEGFRLSTGEKELVVLMPPIDDDASAVCALLSDGAAWSTSALALALGQSQRSVQRALTTEAEAGRVRSTGVGRARRWALVGASVFATALLLPGPGLPR